ncbi:cyclic nucleotide-binding domain-containing protein [Chryseobacterium balustinum]|uniref:cyclic nucleotide-binding domain-containing protein n=1 Tax=Chryseobacterium balustinum TaxID=246 RepID=UPI003CF6F649
MFEHLQNRFSFPKETWGKYRKNFTRLEVPAKTILLKENEISQNAYFIEKGIVRACYNKDGKDVTFQFFMENTMFSSLESFRKGYRVWFHLRRSSLVFCGRLTKKLQTKF